MWSRAGTSSRSSGADLEAACTNSPPPLAKGRFRQHFDGTWETRTLRGGVQRSVFIYKTNLEVFEYFGAVCPRLGEGLPLPDAFAVGTVTLRARDAGLAEPFGDVGYHKNSAWGTATDADGNKYRVRAIAEFNLPPMGHRSSSKKVAGSGLKG